MTVPDTRELVDAARLRIELLGKQDDQDVIAAHESLTALAARVEELTEALRTFADSGRRYYSDGDRICIVPLAWVMAAEAVLVRESGGQP